ncbi:MAG TPA: hypothetical protein DCE78_12345 [Bacteroidetes bacterium]|nr:hypothetical protein [Bacteroidota bacterium]
MLTKKEIGSSAPETGVSPTDVSSLSEKKESSELVYSSVGHALHFVTELFGSTEKAVHVCEPLLTLTLRQPVSCT